MNPPITPDELVSLNRTMASLYEAAFRWSDRMEVAENDRDHLAGILEKVARAFDQPSVVALLDFADLPQKVAELAKQAEQCQSWRDEFVKAENRAIALSQELEGVRANLARMDERVGDLLRENETLARNVPPEPPTDTPIVMTYDQASFQTAKVIGQAWCRLKPGTYSPALAVLDMPPNDLMVLCNVHQDTTTGALTYRPVAVKDLPIVP